MSNHKEALQKILELTQNSLMSGVINEINDIATEAIQSESEEPSPSIEKINWSPHEILKEIEHNKQMSGQANNHLEELEKWAEENCGTNFNLGNAKYLSLETKYVPLKDLLNKIQELKTKQ